MGRLGAFVSFALVAWCESALSSSQINDENLAMRAQAVLAARCSACHSSGGTAFKGVVVNDHGRLVGEGKAVVPGSRDSLMLRLVETGAMPAGGERLPEAEIRLLVEWVMRGAPQWGAEHAASSPDPISESEVARFVEDDLLRAAASDRPSLRYFVLTHLDNAGAGENELDRHRQALAKLLNSLSWQRTIARPQPVDVRGTILRINLQDFGWTQDTWKRIAEEYPYAVLRPEYRRIQDLTGTPVSYIRVDWFAAAAAAPPLYNDILRLPDTLSELEHTLGVDTRRRSDNSAIRAGIRTSGVARHNRVLERHPTKDGAYWKSYDFASSSGSDNIFRNPLNRDAAGNEVIFSLPNGMQGYYLAGASGRRIDEAPTDIAFDRTDPNRAAIMNGRSCMSCHFDGIKSFRDDVRPVLLRQSHAGGSRDALQLYAGQAVLDRLVASDAARFRRAVAEAGVVLAAEPRSEAVGMVARKFESSLGLELAAAELGLHAPVLTSVLQSNSRLMDLGFGQLLVENGSVNRDLWEEQFPEVVRGCSLGEARRVRRGPVGGPAFAQAAAVLLGERGWSRRGGQVLSSRGRGASRQNRGRANDALLGALAGARLGANVSRSGKGAAIGAAAGAAVTLLGR